MPELDARLLEHELLEHPFEGGAAARERDELVVGRTRQPVGQRRGKMLRERDLCRTGAQERVENVGRPIAQEIAEAGQEGV